MTGRRVLMFVASVALGALLIVGLIRLGRIDMASTLRQVRSVTFSAFAKLILLNIVLIFLSTEKWRSVDSALRSSSDPAPSKWASFVLTSIGMALGFVLPVQLGMAASRTVGTYFYGRPFKRGLVGSLFEQSFDLLIVCFLAVASLFTRLLHGEAFVWVTLAVALIVIASLATGPATRVTRALARFLSAKMRPNNRIGAGLNRLSELEDSGVLSARLARRLVILSALRFGVVVLIAGETAAAVGTPLRLWHIAAAVPFVVLASALAITPGGVGVNELTYAAALSLFGSPFSIGASWAIVNRILGMASCYVVAGIAAITFAIGNLAGLRRPYAVAQGPRSNSHTHTESGEPR